MWKHFHINDSNAFCYLFLVVFCTDSRVRISAIAIHKKTALLFSKAVFGAYGIPSAHSRKCQTCLFALLSDILPAGGAHFSLSSFPAATMALPCRPNCSNRFHTGL